MNTYKRDDKLSNDTIFTQKLDYTLNIHIYTKNGGFIRRISTKEPISATKHIYKITTFWHLSRGVKRQGLYTLEGEVVSDATKFVSMKPFSKKEIWHMRLGHVSERGLVELGKQNLLGDVRGKK